MIGLVLSWMMANLLEQGQVGAINVLLSRDVKDLDCTYCMTKIYQKMGQVGGMGRARTEERWGGMGRDIGRSRIAGDLDVE